MSNTLILSILTLLVGVGGGYYIHSIRLQRKKDRAYEEAKNVLSVAQEKKDKMLRDAKKEIDHLQEEFRKEEKQMRNQIMEQEKKVIQKEEKIDQKSEHIEKQKGEMESKLKNLEEKKVEIENVKKKQLEELSHIANLSREEAEKKLFTMVEGEIKDDLLKHIKKVQAEIKEEADERARSIISEALSRTASDIVSETTVTLVDIPNEEMKGRIIGREGRNINAIEKYTGVDVIVDDTPGVILVSGFDLVRRYVAKLALEKLIADGRIHPTHIEEAVNKARADVEKHIKEIGERVVYELGITGFHPDLIQLLGRLKFRTSFGQNVLKHSVEVAYISEYIAEELGADVNTVKKGAILHDIGKAVDHEITGNHSTIGADIAKKFGLSEEVIHIIKSADEMEPPRSVEAVIVATANKISIARPGAKKKGLESFVKRLKDLETIATNFDGVQSAYAIQGGREVRVIVNPEKIDDMAAYKLAKKIADAIEKDLKYTGQIKVSLLRETQLIEYAK